MREGSLGHRIIPQTRLMIIYQWKSESNQGVLRQKNPFMTPHWHPNRGFSGSKTPFSTLPVFAPSCLRPFLSSTHFGTGGPKSRFCRPEFPVATLRSCPKATVVHVLSVICGIGAERLQYTSEHAKTAQIPSLGFFTMPRIPFRPSWNDCSHCSSPCLPLCSSDFSF